MLFLLAINFNVNSSAYDDIERNYDVSLGVQTVSISHSFFHDLFITDDSAVNVSDTNNGLIVTQTTFSSLISSIGTCSIKSEGRETIVINCCFSMIKALYSGGSYNGGTCVAVYNSDFDCSRLSIDRAITKNPLSHAVFQASLSKGFFSHSNNSNGKAHSDGNHINSLFLSESGSFEASYSTVTKMNGGIAVQAENGISGKLFHFIFIYISSTSNLIESYSDSFYVTNSSCINCGPVKTYSKTLLTGWYFDDEPLSGSYASITQKSHTLHLPLREMRYFKILFYSEEKEKPQSNSDVSPNVC